MRTRRTAVAMALAAVATTFAASPSHALESCKAKISSKDGTILVSAKGVSGTLEWGDAAGQETNAFANAATCVVDGTANKCELGAPGSAQRITPPGLCTIFLADGGGACSAFLKGCTPGLRTVGSGFVSRSGDVMTGPLRAPSIDTAFGVPGCGVGDVCAQLRLVSQFGGAQIGGDLVLEDGITQSSSNHGVVKAGLVLDCGGTFASITRSFNTTGSGGSFSVVGDGFTESGACTITTPFAITNRYFSATGLGSSGDVTVTLNPTSSNTLKVRRSRETLGVLNGSDGLVSILIY